MGKPKLCVSMQCFILLPKDIPRLTLDPSWLLIGNRGDLMHEEWLKSPMVDWFKCHTDFFLWSPTRKAWRMNELSVTQICFPINFALRHIDFPPGMKCKLVSKVGFYYNESVSLSITQNVENLSKWLCLYRSLKKSLSTVFVKATFATRISSPAVDTISSTIQPRSSQTLTIITIIWISPPNSPDYFRLRFPFLPRLRHHVRCLRPQTMTIWAKTSVDII